MDEERHPLTDDPEIAALLDFEPVVRKCKRHDGWTPENQRRYIVGLAETGNPEQAAHPLGRTMSGAYKVRTSAGGEAFGAAWDKALALHLRRNPRPSPKGRPSRGELLAGTGRRAWPAAAAAAPPAPEPEPSEAEKAKAKEEWFDGILQRYLLKLGAERDARRAGRIAEADFYVRQLTYIELILDLGGRSMEVLETLKRGGRHPLNILATPMSVYLDKVRRLLWEEQGEPERPPLSPLGAHDGEVAFGVPTYWRSNRGISFQDWQRERSQAAAVAAEAQKAWEEKAAKDAEAWAERETTASPVPRRRSGSSGAAATDLPGTDEDEARDPEPSP